MSAIRKEVIVRVSRRDATPSPPTAHKPRVTLRLDPEVVAWFRGQALEQGSGHYQTMINAALQQHIVAQGKTLEDRIRRIVREELGAHQRTSQKEGSHAS
jgi:uncharacterized protein (DUF4415 family)